MVKNPPAKQERQVQSLGHTAVKKSYKAVCLKDEWTKEDPLSTEVPTQCESKMISSPPVVILEPRKIRSDTVSPSISHEVVGPDAMIFVF